jgi:dihydrolipoamide dehydrogenase
MNSFDVVISSGPGGYVSAIVVHNFFKTAIIEKYPVLGGTCLNVGVFLQNLLASSHHYSDVAHFADHGIEISGEVKVNLEKMIARKQAIVDQTTGGVKYLMDKNKITVLEGLGFVDATT